MYDIALLGFIGFPTYLRVWAARASNRVYVEWHVVHQHVRVAGPVPVLPPVEVAVLRLREPLLPGVVNALDDCTARHIGIFQQVRHRRTVAKRVHRPSGLDVHSQVVLHPLVAYYNR